MEMEELLKKGARNLSHEEEYSPLFEIIFSNRRSKQLEAIELILQYFPEGKLMSHISDSQTGND